MDINIQSIHFDATTELKSFIEKKTTKLTRFADDISVIEVILKVNKPEAANNKSASLKVTAPQAEYFAEKVSDSFEQSISEANEAIERQIKKRKEKK